MEETENRDRKRYIGPNKIPFLCVPEAFRITLHIYSYPHLQLRHFTKAFTINSVLVSLQPRYGFFGGSIRVVNRDSGGSRGRIMPLCYTDLWFRIKFQLLCFDSPNLYGDKLCLNILP